MALRIFGLGLLGVLILAVVAPVLISPRVTPWVEGPEFRRMLDRETSKGLHFEGRYGTITRTGFLTAAAEDFRADRGAQAMKTLTAEGVTTRFNPLGIFRRLWQLDYIRIRRGTVEVQTYKPQPKAPVHKPWYAIFLPSRVYLGSVVCDSADVTWQIKGETGGIFDTRVKILPRGRNFEYFAKGGTLRLPGKIPEHDLQDLQLLITKEIIKVYLLKLTPADDDAASVTLTGEMGMGEKNDVRMKLKVEGMALKPWLPTALAGEVRGKASGNLTWTGPNPTLEASSGTGEISIDGGELENLELLDFLASATAKKSFRLIKFTRSQVQFRWNYPEFEISSLNLEESGKLALRGSLRVREGALSGSLELGLAPSYLEWLPGAQKDIFTRSDEGLAWTTVQLSGTLEKPENDLTPRLVKQLERHPGAAAGLLIRSAGEWILQKFEGR